MLAKSIPNFSLMTRVTNRKTLTTFANLRWSNGPPPPTSVFLKSRSALLLHEAADDPLETAQPRLLFEDLLQKRDEANNCENFHNIDFYEIEMNKFNINSLSLKNKPLLRF
jgi:hypothetical protein